MQGRGDNRLKEWINPPLAKPGRCGLYLIGLWLTCLPVWSMAQLPGPSGLTWYIPQSPTNTGLIDSPYVIQYTSWTDLAEKLATRAGKPYHLSMVLDKNTPADWAALQTIPPAGSLAIELADSVMSTQLLPVLATWPTLKRLTISAPSGPRSFTFVTNAKGGETMFGNKPAQKRLAQPGWDKLRALNELALSGDIDLQTAITALQALPMLESLTIQSFDFSRTRNVPPALAGMTSLKQLRLEGLTRQFAGAFNSLRSLRSLSVFDPDIADLNAGLVYLTSLESLEIRTFGQSPELKNARLSTLPTLKRLAMYSSVLKTAIPLDSVLGGLTGLERLTLGPMKLQSFPVSLLANKSLTYLAMPDAGLTALPENLDQLAALEELIIDNNPLHRLPNALCRLPRLRQLSVSRCELDSLPAAIGQLTSLTNLSLNSNQLTALPQSVGQLQELRQLNVAMNQLTALPAELVRLPKLEIIAAFWNKITTFPVGLTQVRELYLTDNLLTELPASLGTLTNLQTLLLDNNPLTSLPESIGQLRSLETLVLGHNQLTALPKAIGSLRQLRRFVLGQNQVRDLPESIGGLTSLTSVSLSDNPISRLPTSIGEWKKLTFVQLKLPQLEALPEQIGRWQALKTLSVESDKLVVIPNELTDCVQLADLSVTGKRLIGLPESLGKLTHLERLSLEGRVDTLTRQGRGQVIALPASLANCKQMTTLLVLNQQQFDGVEGIQLAANLPRLKHLTFINCGITDLSGITWRNLSATTLNLSQNRFSQLPAALLEMPNLEQVNLSETNLPQHLNRFFLRRTELAEALKKAAE